MTLDELVNLPPQTIADELAKLATAFADKAEVLYDGDPENNGMVAQPYADVASMVFSASQAWDPEEDEKDSFFLPDGTEDSPGEAELPAPGPGTKPAPSTRSSGWGARTKNPFTGKVT